MAKKPKDSQNSYKQIPFRMHPRVFASLGADLVTNDVVAVIELVKNSYDAFATNVWLRFGRNQTLGDYLDIEDDGEGMNREVIENVWCVVATPFKEMNPYAKVGTKKRRVAGEKGLGRLSVARLGDRLNMLTQAKGSSCWEVEVDWDSISKGDNLKKSYIEFREYRGESPFKRTGTRLRISGLKGQWDDNQIFDLEDNLARLISPFSDLDEFNIYLSGFDENTEEEVKIESPEFLSRPKYSIAGEVDRVGSMKATYKFSPISKGKARKKNVELTWGQIYDLVQDKDKYSFSPRRANCGKFSFEIRAWDIGPEDTQEIADRFEFQKSEIRKSIRAHKGISIYRDSVLVLPKSDNARDWLGLDLRRISKVGSRLSTSQIVGYVSISAEDNPKIEDTSDRERLVSRREVGEFEEILKAVVALLENERDEDRVPPKNEKPADDLFSGLSADELLAEVVALSEEGADASDALPLLRTFSAALDEARKSIQERFVYYSRLATIGTIAQMLVHEIRGRTTAFGNFLDYIKSRYGPFKDDELKKEYRWADNAVDALERLADTFSPLANRGFKRRKRQSVLETQLHECVMLQKRELDKRNISVSLPNSETTVAVDPGELDAIVLNLLTNSIYWLNNTPREKREIQFRLAPISGGKRVRVWVHDTGPGISGDDLEKVLWPGVTRKPGGIGMGLTIASELVAAYGGSMTVKYPGTKGGASLAFDLPLK